MKMVRRRPGEEDKEWVVVHVSGGDFPNMDHAIAQVISEKEIEYRDIIFVSDEDARFVTKSTALPSGNYLLELSRFINPAD